MTSGLTEIPVRFWSSLSGNEPVRDFLRELPKSDRMALGTDLGKLLLGWPIGMPLVRNLGGGLWELRSSLPNRREVRIVFATGKQQLVLLHAFFKKSQKTPASALQIARRRLKEIKS